MSPLTKMDRGIALGYLKGGGSNDPQVVRSRHADMIGQMQMARTALIACFVFGGIMCLVGTVMLIVLVGIIPLGIGITLIVVGVTMRARLAQNITVLDAAYREFATMV
jgi:hypothetical protein